MSPGGHAVTTVIDGDRAGDDHAPAGLVLGVAAGGFFIDVDHVVDYVLVNRQTDLRPATFLRYYLEGRAGQVVLALHSYELFALLVALAWWLQSSLLWGYLLGGLMHLVLDILFNGEFLPSNVLAFYSFAYRATHRFQAVALHGGRLRAAAPAGFWRAFFAGARAETEDT